MARGTLVGEAFIRVHADNTAFAREVASGMRSIRDSGEEAGEEWGKNFFDSLKSELESKMDREFKQGFLSGDFSAFARNFGDVREAIAHVNVELGRMRDQGGLAEHDFEDLANVVQRFADAVDDAEDKADFSRRAKGMESYAAALTRAANEMGHFRDNARPTSLTLDDIEQHIAQNRRGFNEWAAALTKASEQMGHFRTTSKLLSEDTRRNSLDLRDLERVIHEGRGFEALADQMTAAANAMNFQRGNILGLSLRWEDLKKHMASAGAETDRTRARLRETGKETVTFTAHLDLLSRKFRDIDIGRIFGRGSRNDFLNIVGAIIGGITRISESMVGLVGSGINLLAKGLGNLGQKVFGNLIQQLGESSGAFNEFFTTLSQGLAGIGKVAGPVIAVIATLAAVSGGVTAGILLLGEALGIVTSALSLLLGGVVAVAGAIEIALVGALGVAMPLLFVFGVQIATLVTGLTNLTDAQKEAVKPIGDLFKALQTKVQATLFSDLTNQVKGLGLLIQNFLTPLLVGVAGTLTRSFTTFLNIMNSATFKPFLDALTGATTRISESLGNALATALPGIIAFFTPILPLAEQLANSIEQVATTFTNWATSAAGQTQIKDFFTQAWQEAQTLWQILLNVGGALQTLLSAGNNAVGQQFLGWLQEKTADLKAFLESPAGQNKLADWFAAAQEFGENLWTAIEKVGSALASLDTPANREIANKIAIGFGRLFDVIKQLGPAFEITGKAIGFFFAGVVKVLGGMLQTAGQVAGVFSALFSLLGHLPGMDWANQVAADLDILGDSVTTAGMALSGLPEQIQIDFEGDTGPLHTAAQEADTMVAGVDKDHTTTFSGSVTQTPAAAAAGKASLKTVVDSLIPGLIAGVPAELTIPIAGDTSQLKKDADAITKELSENATSVDVPFNLDVSTLDQQVAHANDFIIQHLDPNFKIPINAETLPMIDDVNAAYAKIRAIPPPSVEIRGDNTAMIAMAAEAETALLAIPPSKDVLMTGNNNDLITKAAEANTELLVKVPPQWMTLFMGDPQPLKTSIQISSAALHTFDEQWSEVHTGFIGDTAALMDATTVVAPALINSVNDENTTFLKGENSNLNTAVGNANRAINGVQDENTTYFKGNVSDLLAKIAFARSQVQSLLTQFPTAFTGHDVGSASGGIFGWAPGGITRGPQVRLIGEDGPEAVVPLRRSLARVDPSVRSLSAFAQGMMPGGITVESGAIQVNVPNANPRNVAESVLDRLIARLN